MLISKPYTGDHRILLWLRVKLALFVVIFLWLFLFWLMGWIPWIKDEYQILFSLVLLLGLTYQSYPFLCKIFHLQRMEAILPHIRPCLSSNRKHKILLLNRSIQLEKYMYSQAIKISTNVLKKQDMG